MDTQTLDLSQLFRVAQEAMAANRQQINAMDGYNAIMVTTWSRTCV